MTRTEIHYSADDPLSFALRPPADETPAERQARLEQERLAKEISDGIDRQISLEREALKRKGAHADIKLLLLGQAESGKSTLQKQFRLMYSPQTLEEERVSWRSVVYLNVVKSVKAIIESLDLDDDEYSSDLGYQPSTHSRKHAADLLELANLRLRLLPLLTLEQSLSGKIAGLEHITVHQSPVVRAGWQQAVARGRRSRGKGSDDDLSSSSDNSTMRMLAASQGDVRLLWRHPCVVSMVKRRRLRLEDSSSFFLDQLERISQPDYIPTMEDILRSRLRTLGIVEHVFNIRVGAKPAIWRLFDVGGSRGQRHSWAPYFEDANAIIFLAPISAFDQYLEEDHRVNRIDDSLQLFIQICGNALLKSASLVLFLNKTDLLQAKLKAGVKVKRYITSFANRPNEYDEVAQYFRAHFSQAHRKHVIDHKRVLFIHFTSVVDIKTTKEIIHNVRDGIFRQYLKESALI